VIKVELDFPAPELFPNRSKGKHWATLHKHKTAARDAAFVKTIRLGPPPTFITAELYLIITFEMPDKRHRDVDNCLAAAKSALDGVAIALRVDDSRFNPLIIFRKPGQKPGKMIVEIKEAV
jgi:crossover junction endodeoxyribonuclease RusA